ARESRDADGSGVEFKRQLDADKPKQPAKPQPKKQHPQDDATQADAQAQAQAQPQTPPLQMPRSFTDLGDAITRALTALKQAEAGVASVAAAPVQAPATDDAHVAPAALTPPEQAVHDLIGALPQPKPPGQAAA